MKISKSLLKSVVKECLVEILAEGLGTTINESVKAKPLTITPSQKAKSFSRNVMHPAVAEKISLEANGNPIMTQIFEDTAKNTLPKILEEDRGDRTPPRGHTVIDQIVEKSSPVELFGEDTAARWANLAFMNEK